MIVTRFIALAVAALFLSAGLPTEVSAQLSKQESKCVKKLPGTALKLASTTLKETSKCLDDDISGKTVGACPNASNTAKIDKAAAKLTADIEKNCQSTCSVSGLSCVSDRSCPALAVAGRESCNAAAPGKDMDIRNLGFPGGLCPLTVGGNTDTAEDVDTCVQSLAADVTDEFLNVVYGSITNASALTADQAKCLSGISKAAQKLGVTALKTASKCRQGIDKGKIIAAPANCVTVDPKSISKIAKAEAKLAKAFDSKCTDADVTALDICNNGVGGTPDRLSGTLCLTANARELFVAASVDYANRYATIPSLEEVVYPSRGRCGDGLVNVLQGEFNQYAEECDGDDNDAACDGECLPPGDLFECSCGNVSRTQYYSLSAVSTLDSGWTGTSHGSRVNQGGGFVSDLVNCDCSLMDNAECIGTSVDPICDTLGIQKPRCSWDPAGVNGCDEHGDMDGVARDGDCYICDGDASNSGSSCDEDTDCNAQCIDAGGSPTGACSSQSDCAAGETCLGKCDFDAFCTIVLLSHPTPLSSSGNPTCLRSEYREDIYGTTHLVTGERESYQSVRTRVHLGENVSQPCPVCGGWCVGGTQEFEICEGSCSVSGDACRFDTDCPIAESCTSASVDCPGGECQLELRCNGGDNDGLACRVGSFTEEFGLTSLDCPPNGASNISGDGLEVYFAPSSSELQQLDYTEACTAPGFELYDCPCIDDGGQPTKPNTCLAGCDGGAELGTGCGTGNSSGQFTLCVGGANNASACDEDTDCPGGTCSGNPTHCVGTGDPATELNTCTTNGDCGVGTCMDACPSGRCTPLCEAEIGNPYKGRCSAGPIQYRCNGPKDGFRSCTAVEEAGGCLAVCSISATACVGDSDCPSGEACEGDCLNARLCEAGEDGIVGTPDDITGAGICTSDLRRCFLNPIVVEGGDTFNGLGGPNYGNAPSVYCTGATNSLIINASAGLGGPGVLRSQGPIIANGHPTIP
jgi:hypothetical protein